MKIKHSFIIFLTLCFCFAFTTSNFNNPPIKINSVNFSNLYKLNDSIYRSGQPHKKGMKELEEMGIKTIVNLRNTKNDCKEAKSTQLKLIHIPINTWRMDYADVVAGLKAIKAAEKPCLIHCWHGSDRTGVMIAANRMVNENWTKEMAITEFKEKQFGYHEKWFPKLVNLLQDIDIEQIKKDIAQ